ncbi:hypothetical protein LJC02_04610, partial [Breznakia sp. OttesenSCG-928-G09]|nr:hypothetical protein [Breznakia sp. OttesenSCG-928-G09]
MKLVKLVCPNCGGKVKADPSLKTAECKYCHSEFLIDDEEPTINNYYTYDKINVRKPDSKRVMLGIIAFFVILSMITIPMLMHLGSSSSSNSGKVQDLPEGKVMKEFVAVALEKDFDEIDQEDLAKIKYVSVRYDKMKQGYDFQYSFENYFKNKADFGASIKHLLISSE